MAERWQVEGHYVMACNCDFGCPCNFNARPTPGFCEGVVAFLVERGRYGDVTLDGAKAAALVSWPGAIHEGGGKGVLCVDESANDDQREAMRAILSGDVGGPFGMIMRNTVSELSGPHFVPITATVNGKESEFSVDGKIRIVFDAIRNPVTQAEAFPRVVLPQGLWSNELEQFTTSVFDAADADMRMSHPGKVAQLARISWQGP